MYTQWATRALVRRGHQVHVFHRRSIAGQGLERRIDEGVEVWAAWNRVPTPSRRFLASFGDPELQTTFEQALAEMRPDLVHVEHMMGLPVSLIRTIRTRRIPFVITLWDYWWICANAQLLTNYSQRICDGPRAYVNCRSLCPGPRRSAFPLACCAGVGFVARFAQPVAAERRGLPAGRVIAPTDFVRRWYTAHGT